MNEKILIIDREPDNREIMECLLGAKGYRVRSGSDFEEALTIFSSEPFDLVITEGSPPGREERDFIRELKRLNNEVEVIVVSGHATFDTIIQSMRAHGAFDFIPKPLTSIDRLFNSVDEALEMQRIRREKETSGKPGHMEKDWAKRSNTEGFAKNLPEDHSHESGSL